MTLSYKKRRQALRRPIKLLIISSLVVIGLIAVGIMIIQLHPALQKKVAVTTAHSATTLKPVKQSILIPIPTPPKPVGFDKTRYSTSDPSSLWVVANKKHTLPSAYIPADLIEGYGGFVYSNRLNDDLMAMIQAAKQDAVKLSLDSAYRSYANQQVLYASYVQKYGQATADTISARPGFSEHQTGLALDINDALNKACQFDTSCAGGTSAGVWLAAHAAMYGFIIRYTAGNEAVTGYSPEPWHVRYVGHELATEMQKDGIDTLEQFFGVDGGDYDE